MSTKKSESNSDHGAWLTIKLDAESNKQLTLSANRSNRPKKKEALIRIKDHLNKFQAIAAVGITVAVEEKKS